MNQKELYKKLLFQVLKENKNLDEWKNNLYSLGVDIETSKLNYSNTLIKMICFLTHSEHLSEIEDFLYWWLFEDVNKIIIETNSKSKKSNKIDVNDIESFCEYITNTYYIEILVENEQEYFENCNKFLFPYSKTMNDPDFENFITNLKNMKNE